MDENNLNEQLPGDFPEPSAEDKAVEENVRKAYTEEISSGKPRTINELKNFCDSRKMPLEKMRFFIGTDYREPKAFGIYQSGDEFIVYKNKADGSRAVRYQGKDEAYAVNELYEKLLDECHMRGYYPERGSTSSGNPSNLSSYRGSRKSSSAGSSSGKSGQSCLLFVLGACGLFYRWVFFLISWIFHVLYFIVVRLFNPLVVIAAGISFFLAYKFIPKEKFSKNMHKVLLIGIPVIVLIAGQFIRNIGTGYYRDGEKSYYRDKESWYRYVSGSWQKMSERPKLSDDREYFTSAENFPVYIQDITDSYWWADRFIRDINFPRFPSDPGIIDDLFSGDGSSSSDSDSDWDWDWDSGDTDWDSDW